MSVDNAKNRIHALYGNPASTPAMVATTEQLGEVIETVRAQGTQLAVLTTQVQADHQEARIILC